MVQTRGKRGRTVPILLTNNDKANIEVLRSHRAAVGIHPANPFVFARARNSLQPVRGWDCLHAMAHKADLKQPVAVTSTKLRKYVATVSQVVDLNNNELDWLARHLGHDIQVHRDFIANKNPLLNLQKSANYWLQLTRATFPSGQERNLMK